jgi:hypothetical protein
VHSYFLAFKKKNVLYAETSKYLVNESTSQKIGLLLHPSTFFFLIEQFQAAGCRPALLPVFDKI